MIPSDSIKTIIHKIDSFTEKKVIQYIIYVLLFPTVFLIVFTITNSDYFNAEINYVGDLGAMGLQILRAMDFEEYLGIYSRWRWNHPGPIATYYLALSENIIPFFSISGKHAFAVLLLNYAFMVFSLHIISTTFSENRNNSILFFFAMMLAIFAFSKDAFLQIWPPCLIIIPMIAYLLSIFRFSQGNMKFIFPAALSSIFAFQTHVTTGIIIFPLLLVALFMYILNIRKLEQKISRKDLVYLSITIILVIITFFPVFYEQFSAENGNLSKLIKFFMSSKTDSFSLNTATNFIGNFFVKPIQTILPFNKLLFLFMAIVFIIIEYMKRDPQNKLLIFVTIGILFSIIGVMNVRIGPQFHKLFWLHDYQLFSTISFVAMFYFYLFRRVCHITDYRIFESRLVVLFLVFTILFVSSHLKITPQTFSKIDQYISEINPQKNKTYHIDFGSDELSLNQFTTATGIAYKLKRKGYNVCASEKWNLLFGKELQCKDEKNIIKVNFLQTEKIDNILDTVKVVNVSKMEIIK